MTCSYARDCVAMHTASSWPRPVITGTEGNDAVALVLSAGDQSKSPRRKRIPVGLALESSERNVHCRSCQRDVDQQMEDSTETYNGPETEIFKDENFYVFFGQLQW